MSISIRDVLLDGRETDIYIEGNRIAEVGVRQEADKVIDGQGKALLPGLVNAHTHAAMTLLRGYADDMHLNDWLTRKIWPVEATLTQEDVYWGTKLGCLEMIKSGTTCFNDMYWHVEGAARAVEEMGMRAVLSVPLIDLGEGETLTKQIKLNEKVVPILRDGCDRITPAVGPHGVNTVSEEGWSWVVDYSREQELIINTHLCEEEQEIKQCEKKHGVRPVPFLKKKGVLGPKLVAAHGIFFNQSEIDLLGKNQVNIVHNPTSNLKLATNGVLNYPALSKANVNVALGTDGASSNNNLDMFESMKMAALVQKFAANDSTVLPAAQAVRMATFAGAKALGVGAGVITQGHLADLILIDLDKPELTPLHNLEANLVYSANGGCVDTVICDGQVLMEGGSVPGEKELLLRAGEVGRDLVSRIGAN